MKRENRQSDFSKTAEREKIGVECLSTAATKQRNGGIAKQAIIKNNYILDLIQ